MIGCRPRAAATCLAICGTESCGTCAPCRIGSGRGAALAERVVAGDASALAEQHPLLATLETASMCAFGRGVPASIRSLIRVYADELPA